MRSFATIALTGTVAILAGWFGYIEDAAAEAVPRAELLASMCTTCHGTNGEGARPNPKISGGDPDHFVEVMQAFASGKKKSTIMGRHAQGYTETELRLLAEYFSRQ